MIKQQTNTALLARDLRVSFGVTPVIDDVAIDLRPGGITAIVGPNGSGKSTLLRSLARLVTTDRGTLSVGDADDAFSLSSKEFARHLALLSQHMPAPAGMTVREVVWFGRYPHRSAWRGRDEDGPAAIDEALKLTGLVELADATMDTLSGGQMQRAWIASSLAQHTDVLLLDEPTNHLDLRYQVDVLNLIGELADNHHTAIGVVMHDLEQAAQIADRLLLLSAGTVVADGDPSHVLDPELLSGVYGTQLSVNSDPANGRISIRPDGLRTRPSALTQPTG